MATINLSGLPNSCKLRKLIVVLKSALKREGVMMKFWITDMSDIRGTDLKSARIEFCYSKDAYKALKLIDGLEYAAGQSVYPLSARMDDEERGRARRRSPSPYNYQARDREYRDRYEEPSYSRYDGYSRERSRSPVCHESSKLDLEIELLRKQRMIIEEERRLLLERKKLELVKEFGPSALKEFKSLEEDRDRDRRYRPERASDYRPERMSHYRPERVSDYRPERVSDYRPERASDYKPRRRSPPPPRAQFAPRQRPLKERTTLPQFLLPCKLLLAELKELMEKLGTRKESFLLTKLIRATIRKRIAVALEGKPIMSGVKIVALYREKYPNHQDEDFVKKHLKDLRACHLPSKGDDTEETGEKAEVKEEQENNGVDEKVDAGTEEQDTNSDAENKIMEANEPKVTIKEEPNTSTETQILEPQFEPTDTGEQAERTECRSVGSSEALTLHDGNDEDWVEGEHGWDDTNEQATQQ